MDKLTPPTDNLYKFWAIGWLIASLFCMSYPVYENEKLGELNVRVSLELVKSRSEIMPLLSQREAVAAEIERFKKTGDQLPLARALEEQKIIEARSSGINAAIVQLQELQRRTQPASDITLRYTSWWIWFFVFSVVMSLGGFWRWWTGFQQYQDKQLKAEADYAVLRYRRLEAEEEAKYKIHAG